MADTHTSFRGVVIIEAAITLISVLTVLLSAWGAIELYQQGLTLEETVENAFYDGVAPSYRFDSSDKIQPIRIDHRRILSFVQEKAAQAAEQLRAQGAQEASFTVQGAVAEIRWTSDSSPYLEQLTLTLPVGGGQLVEKTSDFRRYVDDFMRRASRQKLSRQRFIRPDLWNRIDGVDSSIDSSMMLIGLSAALSVDKGMASYLMKSFGQESVIVRSSFNVLRRDL